MAPAVNILSAENVDGRIGVARGAASRVRAHGTQ
jgi:hypothetical protein